MHNQTTGDHPILLSAQPVLAVSNIQETINFWHQVLGFPDTWTWGEPPNHGGATWHSAFIQFSLNPQLHALSRGNVIWLRVRNLESLYDLHQKNQADIVDPLRVHPWGLAEYMIRDLNGYYIRFAAPATQKNKNSDRQVVSVQIIARKPTATEYRDLISAVGWNDFTNLNLVDRILEAPLYAAVAEAQNKVVGCGLLLGDNASFFYVKDLMVHPDWQGLGIGDALMREISRWLDINAPLNSFVGLFTGDNLSPFYRKFGFQEAFGMHRRIKRKQE